MKLESLGLRWSPENFEILDQTQLPHREIWIAIETVEEMIDAIKALKVRGAPLIGVAAALTLATRVFKGDSRPTLLLEAQRLREARPTAVNLMNCLDRMTRKMEGGADSEALIQEALQIFTEDVELCRRIAENGAGLIQDGDGILTHCNTGGLATAGVGTALGIIREAHRQGKRIHVYVDETRPLLQGARLTAWELQKLQIPMTLITDNMAAHVMGQKKIQRVFVGSDRIAANGDFANKIGTYGVAILASHHRIPFYVAAPFTTVDSQCPKGEMIPIEERRSDEVWGFKTADQQILWAPQKTPTYNPAFDVTPASLISGWVMDQGLYSQQDVEKGVFRKN
jgi:methylthioribose-1-phosphate isomerase